MPAAADWAASLGVALAWAASALALPTAWCTAALLQALGTPVARDGLLLLHAGGFAAEIHSHCTAAWPAALMIAALAAWPELPWASKLRAMLLALPIIWGANAARLVGLVWIGVHAPSQFNWAHEWAAPAALLILVAACVWGASRTPAPRRPQRRASPAASGVIAAGLIGLVPLMLLALPLTGAAVPLLPVSASAARLVQHASPQGGPQGGPQAVIGDIIVKFREGDPTPARAAALAAELQVPLRHLQVTSGREALVAVDRAALAQAFMQRARAEPEVARVQALPAAAATVLPPRHLHWRIELRAGTARDNAAERLGQRLAVAGIAAGMAPGGAAGELQASLDLDALTAALIGRIQQRPDVAYAQANRLLRTMQAPR